MKDLFRIVVLVLWFAVAVVSSYGYIMNLIHLFSDNYYTTKYFILGIVGLFMAPIGTLMGLFI